MTNEEAVRALQDMMYYEKNETKEKSVKWQDALFLAIHALVENQHLKDLHSLNTASIVKGREVNEKLREACRMVLVHKDAEENCRSCYKYLKDALAQAERKQG